MTSDPPTHILPTTSTTTATPSPTHPHTSTPPPTLQGDLYVPLEFDTEWDSTDHVPEPGGSDSEGSDAGGTFFKNQKEDGRKTGNSLRKKFHIGEDLKTLLGTYFNFYVYVRMCVCV